jgi:hypothetical protein
MKKMAIRDMILSKKKKIDPLKRDKNIDKHPIPMLKLINKLERLDNKQYLKEDSNKKPHKIIKR